MSTLASWLFCIIHISPFILPNKTFSVAVIVVISSCSLSRLIWAQWIRWARPFRMTLLFSWISWSWPSIKTSFLFPWDITALTLAFLVDLIDCFLDSIGFVGLRALRWLTVTVFAFRVWRRTRRIWIGIWVRVFTITAALVRYLLQLSKVLLKEHELWRIA